MSISLLANYLALYVPILTGRLEGIVAGRFYESPLVYLALCR